jgi:hypothetical protein
MGWLQVMKRMRKYGAMEQEDRKAKVENGRGASWG